jgi:beta-galactosidase
MTTRKEFRVQNGQFWFNGAPFFIHAGELHYFRIPAEQWTHRLGLLQKAGLNAVATYIPWLWHQPEERLTDLDGRTHPLRNLVDFLDLAAEMGFLIIARPGPYIMAETINEGIPPWVFETHPQVALVDQDRQLQPIASYLHPEFLKCVERWYAAVFEVLAPRQISRGGNIILIQLDNEMGMLQWVRNLIDVNPDTLTRFADYLRADYSDSLPDHYMVSNLVEFLEVQLTQPEPPFGARVLADYRRFYRDYLREYAERLWKTARAFGKEVPPVLNIHGFGRGGKTFPIGLSQLVKAMRIEGMVSATDVYPLFIGEGNFHELLLVNAMTKALHNPQQPLFSIEFQAGGAQDFGGAQTSLYDLHARLSIVCGMRGINHYLFFDGENHPLLSPVKRHDWGHPVRKDGSTRRHYATYPRLSGMLAAYGDALVCSRPKTVAAVGFLLDYFLTEVNNACTQEATNILTHQRETILFDFIARGLALTHRPFDAVELSLAELSAAKHPILWVMMERRCDAAVQQKLIDYVRTGGRLIVVGRMCAEDWHGRPCTLLKDALGVEQFQTGRPFMQTAICAFTHRDIPASFVETYRGDFVEVFAIDGDGGVVGFFQALGAGAVMVLGATFTANTLEDLDVFHQMANRMGCSPLFQLSDWADVRISEGERGNFLFINNYREELLETTISCADVPLFEGRPIHLPPRRGAVLPINWQVRPGVVIPFLTEEIISIEEQDGQIVVRTASGEFRPSAPFDEIG